MWYRFMYKDILCGLFIMIKKVKKKKEEGLPRYQTLIKLWYVHITDYHLIT